VRELAMRPVDLAPLIEQGEDLLGLLGQDAMHRRPARRGIDEFSAGPAGIPAVRADLTELENTAPPASRPTRLDGLVDQVQKPGLRGRVHPAWDSATQPQPPFPSTSVSFTASSLQASESRSISAFAASSS